MSNNDVPLLLTAEMADDINMLSTFGKVRALDVRLALDNIATERAVVIPRRTEAEWQNLMYKELPWLVPSQRAGFIAALRHLKAIRPDGQEGV